VKSVNVKRKEQR